jgi:hypothetical protein
MNYLEIVDSVFIIRIPLTWIHLFVFLLGVRWFIRAWWKACNTTIRLKHWIYQNTWQDSEAQRKGLTASTNHLMKQIVKAVKEGRYK